jgi:hypothetical protein
VARIEVGREILLRKTDGQAAEVAERGGHPHRWLIDGGGIQRIEATDHAEDTGSVVHGATDHRYAVERGPEGNQPVAAHSAISRLHPHHPAKARRLADRATRLGSECGRYHSCCHECGRPAGGTPRYPGWIERMLHPPEGRMLRRRAHRELVEVGLRRNHGPGLAEALDHGRVVRGEIPLEDAGPAGGHLLNGDDVVFERERHAGERTPHRHPIHPGRLGIELLLRPVEGGVERCRRG